MPAIEPHKESFNKTNTFLLFLIGLNFMSWFYYLIILAFIKIALFSKSSRQKNISINTVLIFLFCSFYCLFAPPDVLYGFNAVIKIFSIYLAFVVGRRIVETDGISTKVVIHYTIVLAIGTTLLGALSLISNIRNYGLFGFERIMPEFWTGNMLNATSQSALFLLLSGVSFYVLIIMKKQYLLKIAVFTGIGFLLLNALLTSSRTAIIYPVAAFVISYFSYMFLSKKIKLGNFIFLNLILVTLFVLYQNNVWNIQNVLTQLPLFQRVTNEIYIPLNEDERLKTYSFFVQNMADYPFGGLNSINPIYYMHNLWLDVYAVSGILAFLVLIVFTIRVFILIFNILTNPDICNEFKVFLIGAYTSFILLFMTEPVLLSSPWFFMTFCLITGMTEKYHENFGSVPVVGVIGPTETNPVFEPHSLSQE